MCSPPAEKCIVFALPLADYFFSFSYPFLSTPISSPRPFSPQNAPFLVKGC